MARKMIDFSKLSFEELKEFRDRYDAYIFDMDGCLLHLEAAPIDGAEELLNQMTKHGKSIHVLTDNCMSTISAIAEKINRIFPVIKKENIISCGDLLIRYLKEINFNKKIYVMGAETGIIRELKENGYQVLHDEETPNLSVPFLRKYKFKDDVGAVLVAADLDFNYMKIFKAANYLADPEVLLMQSNLAINALLDPISPAVSSMAACVKTASGRTESFSTGKGSEYCSKYLKSLGFSPERCLFVGDGLSTDIQAGNRSGMDTMLTLTGASSLKDVEIAKNKNQELYIPTYYINSVADLTKAFKIL